MDPSHAAELASLLGDRTRVLTEPQVVEQLSRDFYWYSPVLRKQLDGKVGDLVVMPLDVGEIQAVLRELCYTLFTHPNMLQAFRKWSTRRKNPRKS